MTDNEKELFRRLQNAERAILCIVSVLSDTPPSELHRVLNELGEDYFYSIARNGPMQPNFEMPEDVPND